MNNQGRRKFWPVLLVIALLISGCTGGNGSPDVNADDSESNASTSMPSPKALDDDEASADDVPRGLQPPTSRELIEQALSEGEIDEEEALGYRVLVQFNDPRVPDKYRGAPGSHDISALSRFQRDAEGMRPEVRSAVEPYLMRPTDPDSAFMRPVSELPPLEWTSSSLLQPIHRAFGDRERDTSTNQQPQRCQDWTSLSLEPAAFRVWRCLDTPSAIGGANSLLDPEGEFVHRATRLLEEMTQERPVGLGQPVPDRAFAGRHPDEDESIDIYLLEDGYFAPERNDGDNHLKDVVGLAVASQPFAGTTSSGHILLHLTPTPNLEALLSFMAHEVFHVLQYARNSDGHDSLDWISESTALWAETHYVPTYSVAIHPQFFPQMQRSMLSLMSRIPDSHPYGSYVWPLFMAQESDAGVDSIFSIWDSLANVHKDDIENIILSGIDLHTPWETSFSEFAMRLFNADLPGDAISPRFVHADPRFPDGVTPNLTAIGRLHTLDNMPLTIDYSKTGQIDGGVPPLAYRYDEITVSASAEEDFGVSIKASDKLGENSSTRLEALVKDDSGNYQRREIDLVRGTQFCRASHIILVLSNASLEEVASGSLTIVRGPAPECSLEGGVEWRFSGTRVSAPNTLPWPYRASVELSGTLHVVTGPGQTRALRDGELVDPEVLAKRVDHPLGAEWLKGVEWQDYHPDAGSTWTVTGRYMFERCERSDPSNCRTITTQDFSAPPGPVAELEIVMLDDVPVLRGALPVRTVTDSDDWGHHDESSTWRITCPTAGSWWTHGHRFDFKTPMFSGTTLLHSKGQDNDLVGSWTGAGRNQISFNCENQWSDTTDGTSGSEFSTVGNVTMSQS